MTTLIVQTDRCVNEDLNIYRSLQSFTGSKQHRELAARAQAVVELALPVLRQMLDFDLDVKIRLASFKSKRMYGRYNHATKVATVSYMRRSNRDVLETLAHELVHAEQYHTGRLVNVQMPNLRQWRFEWRGGLTSKGSTYRSYRNQPHEIEAFDKAPRLADDVLIKLGC